MMETISMSRISDIGRADAQAISAEVVGCWVKLPIGVPDSYRAAGFSRWFVQETCESGDIRLCRDYLGRQYTRAIQPGQLAEWEVCNAPKAWAP